jgi:hypothetical protein
MVQHGATCTVVGGSDGRKKLRNGAENPRLAAIFKLAGDELATGFLLNPYLERVLAADAGSATTTPIIASPHRSELWSNPSALQGHFAEMVWIVIAAVGDSLLDDTRLPGVVKRAAHLVESDPHGVSGVTPKEHVL